MADEWEEFDEADFQDTDENIAAPSLDTDSTFQLRYQPAFSTFTQPRP